MLSAAKRLAMVRGEIPRQGALTRHETAKRSAFDSAGRPAPRDVSALDSVASELGGHAARPASIFTQGAA